VHLRLRRRTGQLRARSQNRARHSGRLVMLEPGERQVFRNRLTVLPDAAAVTAMQERVAALKLHGRAVAVTLADYAA